ncbi:unnamed protein product [Cyclocybe aegerita]|uniref:Uncharacterized protein n=1 Tax=Cyclocybe aegerita TaxID=1973307 RepID=A0A8S0XPK1_CYCAE|nr:unnamed protein product [Cyclocybe aegerita]
MMSEYDTSPDFLQEGDASHTRVNAWLRGIALAENEASDTASSPNTAPAAALSLEDRCSRAKRRLRGRSFPNYPGSVNDPSDLSTRYLSSNRASEVFPPPVHFHTSPPVARGPPKPTSTTFSPPSIYSLDSDGHENFLPYIEIDWDSEPAQAWPSNVDEDEAGRRERKASVTSTSPVPSYYFENMPESLCVVHDPSTPTSTASFYVQKCAYYVPTETSAFKEGYPLPDSSCPSPFAMTFSFVPALPSITPTTTSSSLRLQHQSAGREGATGGPSPPTHQRTDSSTSSSAVSLSTTINVTESLAKTYIAGCESPKSCEENPTWDSNQLGEQDLALVIFPG